LGDFLCDFFVFGEGEKKGTAELRFLFYLYSLGARTLIKYGISNGIFAKFSHNFLGTELLIYVPAFNPFWMKKITCFSRKPLLLGYFKRYKIL